MRKFTLVFLFTNLFTIIGQSQVTYVPDNNFEQALIDLGYDSGSLNDYVPTTNISSVTILNIDDKGISDLTGIEDFTALTELRCYTNTISSLDVSANTQLIYLHCSSNNLTSLDVSNNSQLQFLNCSLNAIGSLNLNQNALLSNFDASNNQLTALSIKNGTGNIITNFNATNNPNLACIQVDNANYSTNNWTNIDAQTSFSEDCHYGETYVPDDNFEQALIDLGYDSGSLDDYVTTANISSLTFIDVNNKSISDLTGIEDFVALTSLSCIGNTLASINISNNTNLSTLFCSANNLTSLDISNNTSLDRIFCSSNDLTNLDITNNTLLEDLDCASNDLISINTSNNPLLEYLNCRNNDLTSLNLSNNSSLEYLHCGNNEIIGINLKNGNNTIITTFNATNNPNLTCIQVEDATYSATNWTDIDAQTSFSEDCHYGETYVPDDNFEQALIDLGYDAGSLDDYVLTANINTLTNLVVDGKGISDLTGIEDFTALTTLDCSSNSLTSLDVSNNSALTHLTCSSNGLTSLDVSNNTALTSLYCSINNLTSLDVSNNTALTTLFCHIGNDLTNLDVSNNTLLTVLVCGYINLNSLDVSNNTALESLYCQGNNLSSLNLENNPSLEIIHCIDNDLTSLNLKNGNNTIITSFEATGNPNLTCIEVDDATYSTTNWTDIDAQSGFATNCSSTTYVPDDNFEQALIDLGHDFGPLDDYVFTTNINTITNLVVDDNGISDLTGIEDFTALLTLDCSSNSLTSLDVSNNSALTHLTCSSNSLTSLDVSNNTALTSLYCSINNLTSLDVSNNTALTTLFCHIGNDLTNLDLSNNTLLTVLVCGYTNLNSLDVSNNTVLESLYCQGNNLSSLNLENNPSLEIIHCIDNDLTGLNLKNGNNTIITSFEATGNPNLTCIEVDSATYSTTNWTDIDASTSFSEDCSTLSIDSFAETNISLYPNPVHDELTISAQINGRFNILNVNGQILKQGVLMHGNNTINMSQLEAGLYFLNIKANSSSMLKKIIKK
ncbi:T9SS type A sorting domain-containing protein [Algibacter sp. 2305UL17-15]|uniref:T9SS type A sorting domain-containing protein n=1 Tax=Algibacter sp. 2305UL17-15 TaxID=3231268 RepID=UPI00345A02E8